MDIVVWLFVNYAMLVMLTYNNIFKEDDRKILKYTYLTTVKNHNNNLIQKLNKVTFTI